MTFAQLKAELPALNKHPFESEQVKMNAKADEDAGGSSEEQFTPLLMFLTRVLSSVFYES